MCVCKKMKDNEHEGSECCTTALHDEDRKKLAFSILDAVQSTLSSKLAAFVYSILMAIITYVLDTVFAKKWSLRVDHEDFRGLDFELICTGSRHGKMCSFGATRDKFVCDGVSFEKYEGRTWTYIVSSRSKERINALLKKLGYRSFCNDYGNAKIRVEYCVNGILEPLMFDKSEYAENKLILAEGIYENILRIAEPVFDNEYKPEGLGRKVVHILLKTTKRTGKSSVAYVLAARFGAVVRFLSASDFVMELPHARGEKYIYVVDEADKFFEALTNSETERCQKGVAMLNFQFFADVVMMQPNVLLIYTTNHPEKIDPKFIARCKHSTFEIGCFDRSQAKRYLALFKGFENDDHFIENGTAPDYMEYVNETRAAASKKVK